MLDLQSDTLLPGNTSIFPILYRFLGSKMGTFCEKVQKTHVRDHNDPLKVPTPSMSACKAMTHIHIHHPRH
jgi:hypothetical protein